jgi:endonuclease VIII
MPEGPEIKRAADVLAGAISQQRALLVEFAFPHLARRADELSGFLVTGIEPRGKAMLTHFDNGLSIYSHNQLYGQWRILAHGQAPDPRLQVRLAIHTAGCVAVLYSASEIAIWPRAALPSHPYIARLGTELLAAAITENEVLAQINDARFARRRLAALLLDQGFLAGVGNYLRSEILFVARIHPEKRVADLSMLQRRKLAAAALHLARQSYRTDGITNDESLARTLRARGWPYSRYRHWVFDRGGEACHVCANAITRIEAGGRGLYWCPHCQAPAS